MDKKSALIRLQDELKKAQHCIARHDYGCNLWKVKEEEIKKQIRQIEQR